MFTVHDPLEDEVATPPDTDDRHEIDAWLSETLTTPRSPLVVLNVAPGNSRTVSVELVLAPDEAVCGVTDVGVALAQADPLTTVPLPPGFLIFTSGMVSSSIRSGS